MIIIYSILYFVIYIYICIYIGIYNTYVYLYSSLSYVFFVYSSMYIEYHRTIDVHITMFSLWMCIYIYMSALAKGLMYSQFQEWPSILSLPIVRIPILRWMTIIMYYIPCPDQGAYCLCFGLQFIDRTW